MNRKQWAIERAKVIVATYARWQMRVVVRSVDFGPRLVGFTVVQGQSHSVDAVCRRSDDVAQALRVSPDRLTIRQTAGGLVVAMPNPEPRAVSWESLRGGRPDVVPLGITADGAHTFCWPFGPTITSVLVVAPTRSGKTTLLQTLVYGICSLHSPRGTQLAIVDPKGDDLLAQFAQSAHLRYPIAVAAGESRAVLEDLAREVEDRQVSGRRVPTVYAVIDELPAVMEDGRSREALKPVFTRGGGLGIRLVASTQRADKATLGDTLLVANMPHRLVGRVANALESALATGRDGLEAHKLLGAGDFLAVINRQVERIQVAQVPEELFGRLPVAVVPDLPAIAGDVGPETPEGPGTVGRPAEPIPGDELRYIADHPDRFTSLRAIMKYLGCGLPRAKRAAARAGLGYLLEKEAEHGPA